MKFALTTMLVGLMALLSSAEVAAGGKRDGSADKKLGILGDERRDAYSSVDVEARGKRDGRHAGKHGSKLDGRKNRDKDSTGDKEARGKRGGQRGGKDGKYNDGRGHLNTHSSVDDEARGRRDGYYGGEDGSHYGKAEKRDPYNDDPKQDDVTSRPHKLPNKTSKPAVQPSGKPNVYALCALTFPLNIVLNTIASLSTHPASALLLRYPQFFNHRGQRDLRHAKSSLANYTDQC